MADEEKRLTQFLEKAKASGKITPAEIQEAAEAENRRKEEATRQQEMVAKVEAAAPASAPVAAPTAVQAPELMTDRPTGYWKKMSFTIYFRNPSEYEKVLPALRQLKEILKQEEIQYGK